MRENGSLSILEQITHVKNTSRMSAEGELGNITPYSETIYENIDLTGLATFVLRWLQERNIPSTFENIVVATFRMFPDKFSLHGFPEYPDAARIGRTLMQLGPKYRNWARGSVQKGFVLTESGLTKVKNVQQALHTENPLARSGPQRKQSVPRTMDLSRELKPLEESVLFKKWKEEKLEEGTALELLNMLGAYAYTPPRALRDRVLFLENAADQVGQSELAKFLRAVRGFFASHFRDV